MDITTEGFGKPHANFGILLSMLARILMFQTWGSDIFLVTLMLVFVSSRKCANRDIQHMI